MIEYMLDHQTFEPKKKLKSTQLNIHSKYKPNDIMNRNSLIPNRHTTHIKETSSKDWNLKLNIEIWNT